MSRAILCADYDETLTVEDTIHLLPQLAACELSQTERRRFLERWERDSKWYYSRWEQVFTDALDALSSLPPDPQGRLEALHRAFLDLERESIQMVVQEGYLRGIRRERLIRAGRQVRFHPEARETLQAAAQAGYRLWVLSVNWSRDLIAAGLEDLPVEIVSNDLVFDASGRSTGALQGGLHSGFDKREELRALRKKGGPILYIGDSITDLLALLEADVGILFGEKRSTIRACERCGIARLPLRLEPLPLPPGAVLTTNSWGEIREFLLKIPWRERVGVEPTADA
ncbi:MAG: hypothetical protein KatS3mg115_0202 [Candidatus Poribacteria bacterium]|nr:MAG: hypothetical protein KatS3mg115_0202 [Candidatus Poribacteria bacterium]